MMKYLIIAFLSCLTINAQHLIKTKIIGNPSFKTVQLKKFKNNQWIVLDSISIHRNQFEFKVNNDDDLIYIDSTSDSNFYIKLYNVKGITNISYDLNTNDVSIKGTPVNEGMNKYQKFIKPYIDKIDQYTKQKPVLSNPTHLTKEDFLIYNTYLSNLNKIKEEVEIKTLNYINNNKNNEYSKVLINEKLNGTFKENQYNELKLLYENLDKDLKETLNAKKLESFLKEYKSAVIGAKVKDFTLPDVNGINKSLYKNLGKYTLIDFWASWCGPCRKENPHVVSMYQKYKENGLNIIGVSLDDNKERWLAAIEKDQLTWMHVSNLQGWNEAILKDFKITAIPKTYLIDKNGIIVAKDLKGKELEEKLAELFKK